MPETNRSWGYDRIVGALANLGHSISDQTGGNVLERHGVPPASERKQITTWKEFIRVHTEMLAATDFFTTEVWTKAGLVTGMTPNPDAAWMAQIARNVSMADDGFLKPCQYLPHDRDAKFTEQFDEILKGGGVKPVKLKPELERLGRALGAVGEGKETTKGRTP